MKVGISTSCLFPMLTEDAFETLLKEGVKTVEVFLNSPSEASPIFGSQLAEIAREYDVKATSLHPCTSEHEGVNFFGRYPRRFWDAAEDYKRMFALCNALGADILVFHGARRFFPISQALYFERYNSLWEIAKSFGVSLVQENVVNFFCGYPEFVREMRRELPNAQFVLDIKQAIRGNVNPFEMLDAMGDGLCHLHISDHSFGESCLPPGSGSFDFRRFLGELKGNGYDKSLIIELYRQNFSDLPELLESEKIMTKILRNL